MTSTKNLTRSATLILSLATIGMAISAQIAPANTATATNFASPAATYTITLID
ncbi:hypothetical protein ACS3QZ_05735 [Shimia sp. W99]